MKPTRVRLPVTVYNQDATTAEGITDFISSHEVRFAADDPFFANAGEFLTMFVALPEEVTAGDQVFFRMYGRILRVESMEDLFAGGLVFTVSVTSYDFVRRHDPTDLASGNHHKSASNGAY